MRKVVVHFLSFLSLIASTSALAQIPIVHGPKLDAFVNGAESIRELWGLRQEGYPDIQPKHSVALVDIAPRGSTKNHRHPKIEETYYVLEGSGEVTLKNKNGQYFKSIITKGELLSIPPETEHFMENVSDSKTLKIFVVAAGPWHPKCMEDVDFLPVEQAPTAPVARKGTPLESHGVKVWELWGNDHTHGYNIKPKHSVAVIEIAPKAASVEHRHTSFEETHYVLSGKGFVTLEGETVEIEAGDLVYIPINARHSFSNQTDTPLELLGVAAGPWSINGTVF